ncbi:hypothetical protein LWI28_009731 [Acer negundo]|uniref:Uncharacterized protein n=1 Tax=Acer negundo TaxID=4023 RepID=A0AAD5NJ90_ACENE|nr:hypothetical protein LWI28_009731 [Acer negundo]
MLMGGLVLVVVGGASEKVGHSKDNCKDGVVQQNESKKPPDGVAVEWGDMVDSYGPWMQVSYGRYRKSNDGQHYGNKKLGNIGYYGKTDVGKVFGKTPVNKDIRRQVVPKKDEVKNLGGSRFIILSEDMEGESGGQAKATSSIVLSEISNKGAFRKSQSSCPSSTKYQSGNAPNKVYFNKPFKENVE